MGVAQLVRREAPPDTSTSGHRMKLGAHACGRPWPPTGGPAEDAGRRTDRQLRAQCEPRDELLPGPAVHADLAALAAFAVPDQDCASAWVKVAFHQGERLTDAKGRRATAR
jgi:hypothetical protein